MSVSEPLNEIADGIEGWVVDMSALSTAREDQLIHALHRIHEKHLWAVLGLLFDVIGGVTMSDDPDPALAAALNRIAQAVEDLAQAVRDHEAGR